MPWRWWYAMIIILRLCCYIMLLLCYHILFILRYIFITFRSFSLCSYACLVDIIVYMLSFFPPLLPYEHYTTLCWCHVGIYDTLCQRWRCACSVEAIIESDVVLIFFIMDLSYLYYYFPTLFWYFIICLPAAFYILLWYLRHFTPDAHAFLPLRLFFTPRYAAERRAPCCRFIWRVYAIALCCWYADSSFTALWWRSLR